MTDLIEFLLARIAEDEDAGERAVVWTTPNGLAWIGPTPEAATLLAISGRRVLVECEAKRGIVKLHHEELIERLDDEFPGTPYDALCVVDNDDFPCTTLRLLALPYADHEDYRQEWKP